MIYFLTELPCCQPCGQESGYYANITIPSACEVNDTCLAEDERCCRGTRVEGCSCPDGTYYNGKKCVNSTAVCDRPCISSSSSSSSMSSTRLAQQRLLTILMIVLPTTRNKSFSFITCGRTKTSQCNMINKLLYLYTVQ